MVTRREATRDVDPVGETASIPGPPLGPRRNASVPITTTVAAAVAARNRKPAPPRPDPRDTPAPLTVVHPDAAGIDVHSDMHMVCVPPGRDPDGPVRAFGANTSDLIAVADWLTRCGVTTVALESTGVYWIPLFELLKARGFEVYLVEPGQLSHGGARPKTDVLDAQWIQRLHTYGLLRPSFRPPDSVLALRGYWRQRQMLIRYAASHVQHMQKALERMNVKLTKGNDVRFDATGPLFRALGAVLTEVEGIDVGTALVILAELGIDVSRFPTEKHFASWLGLCPRQHQSNKTQKTRGPRRGKNRVAQALRLAARSVGRTATALGLFYRRIKSRIGAAGAITATARELARLVYRMLKYGRDYVKQSQAEYEAKMKTKPEQLVRRKASALGFELVPKVAPAVT